VVCVGCGSPNAESIESAEGLRSELIPFAQEIEEALDKKKHGQDAFVTDCSVCGVVWGGESKEDFSPIVSVKK